MSGFVTITRMDENHYVSPGKANTFYLCHAFFTFLYLSPSPYDSFVLFNPIYHLTIITIIFRFIVGISCKGSLKVESRGICVIRWYVVQTGVLIIKFTGNHRSQSIYVSGL